MAYFKVMVAAVNWQWDHDNRVKKHPVIRLVKYPISISFNHSKATARDTIASEKVKNP